MLALTVPKTSMYVPEPVISLALKPVGQETPNFSRALNRFQKEDPTFRVHIDKESKEVSYPTLRPCSIVSHRVLPRPLFLVWVNCTSRSTSSA